MKQALFVFLGLACVAAPAVAQEAPGAPATVVLRSGDRLTVDVIDIAAPGLLIRENGRERHIPTAEVAQIDFAGDGRSAAGANATPRILLRNGQTVDGRLSDIGGTQPKILYVDTPSGMRQFSSAEVALVVLAGSPQNVQAAVGTAGRNQGNSIRVPGNSHWTETPVTVREGESLVLRADGEISFAPNERASAAGIPRGTRGGATPLPNAPAGALIGRIDNGPAFLIGRQTSVRMPASGKLFLGINDDVVDDNSGEFQVVIAGRRR
jgi:hypothetical protein